MKGHRWLWGKFRQKVISKTLIAGDALNVVNGKLVGPVPEHASDITAARQSIKKLVTITS